ncbi:hypothetical protein JQ636_04875 [Bradyrhizobium japonicum]|uniref:hypothetical protein n=1 Tax=Bradyrhizobium japonicum TaxID=375 RepID=UPI001BA85851|nr:hypothetical protein [Bradyrhizobium japonicum]MBR0802865.1 hypothetical protein [Bradyrhizobium japonicum]
MLKKGFLDERLQRYTQMTPQDWSNVAGNPRQRDTAMHAKLAIKYLAEPVPPHIEVKMGKLPDGAAYKLDGHTRSYLWDQGLIPVPAMLEVTIYELQNIDEVLAAYQWFDNYLAAEKSTDVMQGAFRANGLHPQSHLVRMGRINTALRRVYRLVASEDEGYDPGWQYDNIYEAVRFFARELTAFDALEPTGKQYPPGVQMAVLITLKRDPEDAAKFWKLYSEEKGKKEDGRMDAVQALTEAVMISKTRNHTHVDLVGDLFAKSLAAFQAFRNSNDYSAVGSGLRPLSLTTVKKYVKRR